MSTLFGQMFLIFFCSLGQLFLYYLIKRKKPLCGAVSAICFLFSPALRAAPCMASAAAVFSVCRVFVFRRRPFCAPRARAGRATRSRSAAPAVLFSAARLFCVASAAWLAAFGRGLQIFFMGKGLSFLLFFFCFPFFFPASFMRYRAKKGNE